MKVVTLDKDIKERVARYGNTVWLCSLIVSTFATLHKILLNQRKQDVVMTGGKLSCLELERFFVV